MKRAPNFLGIGAKKSGTTWISEVLRVHPEIFVAHGKELHYFTENIDKGVEWYLDHFKTVNDQTAVGEYSVSYMDNSEVVSRRIHDFDPAIKLIVVLRNPIDRAFSHYCWSIQKGRSLPSFIDALEQNPGFVSDSLYYRQMTPYWERFPEEQIHFALFDDIQDDPGTVQRGLYRFLGVDETFDSGLTETVIGKTITPRLGFAEAIRRNVYLWAMRNRLPRLITWVKDLGISGLYRRINDRTTSKPQLPVEDRKKAALYFVDDLKRLEDRTGLNVAPWYETE